MSFRLRASARLDPSAGRRGPAAIPTPEAGRGRRAGPVRLLGFPVQTWTAERGTVKSITRSPESTDGSYIPRK